MKTIFTMTITEEDIRYNVDTAATELEEDNQIQFPDADARAEFIDYQLYHYRIFNCVKALFCINRTYLTK